MSGNKIIAIGTEVVELINSSLSSRASSLRSSRGSSRHSSRGSSKLIRRSSNRITSRASSSARVSAHGGRDPGKTGLARTLFEPGGMNYNYY